MNDHAARLGLDETTYTDPIGLDGGNVSSARDLVGLAIRLRREALFRRIVDTPRITVGVAPNEHQLVNRNTLVLEEPFVDGIKTGTTLAAGYVLVASGERQGVELVSAVLGAPGEAERDEATLELLDYGNSLYRERTLVAEGERIATVTLSEGRGRLPLVADSALATVARKDQQVEVEFDAAGAARGRGGARGGVRERDRDPRRPRRGGGRGRRRAHGRGAGRDRAAVLGRARVRRRRRRGARLRDGGGRRGEATAPVVSALGT